MMAMKTITVFLMSMLMIAGSVAASTKDENRMKAAEQAFAEKRYADAKATFENLKDQPQFRDKSYLYLAMIYHETGQVENAMAGLIDFKRYITDKTDVSLIRASENLSEEINKDYNTLDIAIFQQPDQKGVEAGFYDLVFRSEGGLNPAQDARLRLINKVLSQSQSLFGWRSDGTFMRGVIRHFPVRLYDASPMTAEVNGIPIYFRFDFQTRQGLWIPYDIVASEEKPAAAVVYRENIEPITNQAKPPGKSKSRWFILGAVVAAAAAGVAIAASQ
jgi:hypothetical protein